MTIYRAGTLLFQLLLHPLNPKRHPPGRMPLRFKSWRPVLVWLLFTGSRQAELISVLACLACHLLCGICSSTIGPCMAERGRREHHTTGRTSYAGGAFCLARPSSKALSASVEWYTGNHGHTRAGLPAPFFFEPKTTPAIHPATQKSGPHQLRTTLVLIRSFFGDGGAWLGVVLGSLMSGACRAQALACCSIASPWRSGPTSCWPEPVFRSAAGVSIITYVVAPYCR